MNIVFVLGSKTESKSCTRYRNKKIDSNVGNGVPKFTTENKNLTDVIRDKNIEVSNSLHEVTI